MSKLIQVLLFGIFLIAAALLIKHGFGWTTENAILAVGMFGVAVPVIKFLTSTSPTGGSRCELEEVSFQSTDKNFSKSNELWEYKLYAHISNVGNSPDSLTAINTIVRKNRKKLKSYNFVAGARKINENTGHIIPFPIEPHASIVTEGTGSIGITVLEMEKLAHDLDSPWYLECEFVFAHSRTQSITLTSKISQWSKR